MNVCACIVCVFVNVCFLVHLCVSLFVCYMHLCLCACVCLCSLLCVCVCVCVCARGVCAVSDMLSEVACCGDGGEVECDVALCQEKLTDRALHLTHLLPAGYIPVRHTHTHTHKSEQRQRKLVGKS